MAAKLLDTLLERVVKYRIARVRQGKSRWQDDF
jgi:hypothetical protein